MGVAHQVAHHDKLDVPEESVGAVEWHLCFLG